MDFHLELVNFIQAWGQLVPVTERSPGMHRFDLGICYIPVTQVAGPRMGIQDAWRQERVPLQGCLVGNAQCPNFLGSTKSRTGTPKGRKEM